MSLIAKLRAWAREIRRDVVALWLAARDPRVPLHAKLMAALVAAYALSPIDLIPDFIPVLGYLDDLIIVPLGIAAVVAMISRAVMDDLRGLASARGDRPTSRAAAAVFVLVWIGLATAAVWVAWPTVDRLLSERAIPWQGAG